MQNQVIINSIQYLQNRLVDKEKWDVCVLSSAQPLIYATAAYLDGMCEHWDALILDDYEAVMPLPWKSKWGIKYIYSPYFVVAGGLLGKEVSGELVIRFINAIPRFFLLIDLDLHEANFFPGIFSRNGVKFQQRRNTFLNLNRSYQAIFSEYNAQVKRKIKKAAGYHFTIDKRLQVGKVIKLYQEHYYQKDAVVSRYDFKGMIDLLNEKLSVKTRTYILSFPDGDICAFYLLLFDEHYVYWLIGGSTERGKEAVAFYHLTDQVIRDFAGTNRTFRFEGSDNEGVHFFNRQFGGQTVLYPKIKINRLPWPLRYLK